MNKIFYLVLAVTVLAACGQKKDKATQIAELKKQKADIELKLKELEAGDHADTTKVTPVSVLEMQKTTFKGYVEVQSAIAGDQNVYATPQVMSGIVKSVNVQIGQHVSRGQVLATLDAAALDQQILAQQSQLTFAKTMYEKQQKLWAQNIGTEVQLLQAKANYESQQKNIEALQAQKNMYNIAAPITGVIDEMNLKVGDASGITSTAIRVVNNEQLKAQANLGENYLGLVHQGNPVDLVLPDINDTIRTHLTYVAEAVDPVSRAFTVNVKLEKNNKLHPNMSCIMMIANYENPDALVLPVSVIQKTSKGAMVYVADGKVAHIVPVTLGKSSNGKVEILSGLKPGDKVVVAGYEDLDDGENIVIQ